VIFDSLHRTALMAVETAIGQALQYDPATRAAIAELEGTVLAVESTLPPVKFYAIHSSAGITLMGQYEGKPDTTLKGTALSLAGLALDGQNRSSFFGTGVEVRGNPELLGKIRNIMKNLDVDWEAILANLIGDVPAHLIGKSLRSLDHWRKQATGRAGSVFTDFHQEEARPTPARSETEQFSREVRDLSKDVDRLAARIDKLAIQRQGEG